MTRLGLLALSAALIVGAACGASPALPIPSPPPGAVVVTAAATKFVEQSVDAPAGASFQLFFENRDTEPHNVRIWDASGASVFAGEIFNGPAARVETVDAISAGTYRLTCDIHPEMVGVLIAR